MCGHTKPRCMWLKVIQVSNERIIFFNIIHHIFMLMISIDFCNSKPLITVQNSCEKWINHKITYLMVVNLCITWTEFKHLADKFNQ